MRELCGFQLLAKPVMVGGPGMVVEIDETVYARLKYHRGRHFPEQWVFGGICRRPRNASLMQYRVATAKRY